MAQVIGTCHNLWKTWKNNTVASANPLSLMPQEVFSKPIYLSYFVSKINPEYTCDAEKS
jgi:hypothetical protein